MGKFNGLFGNFKGKGKLSHADGHDHTHPESIIDIPVSDDKPENTSKDNQMQQPETNENSGSDFDLESNAIPIKAPDTEQGSIDEKIESDDFIMELNDIESADNADNFFEGLEDELLAETTPVEAITEPALNEPITNEQVTAEPATTAEITLEEPTIHATGVIPTKEPIAKPKKNKKEPKAKKEKIVKSKKIKKPKVKVQKMKSSSPALPVISIDAGDYQVLVEQIVKSCKKMPGILFAGAGTDTLPLTLPVNTAIQLSKNGGKCLIIDLDTKRDAIAAAFDIPTDNNKTNFAAHTYDTTFENLKVWPAHNFAPQTYIAINALIEAAAKKYDYILINVPYLDGHIDRKFIASSSACAFMFTNKDKHEQAERLNNLLTAGKCKIISSLCVIN